MEVRFFVEEGTGEPHIHRHGVTEEEVLEVLAEPFEDREGANDARVAIGITEAGRLLRVIYVRDPELDSVLVVTGYPLGGRAAWAMRRRMRRR